MDTVVSQDTTPQVVGIVPMATALIDTMCVMASMTVSMALMKLIVVSILYAIGYKLHVAI